MTIVKPNPGTPDNTTVQVPSDLWKRVGRQAVDKRLDKRRVLIALLEFALDEQEAADARGEAYDVEDRSGDEEGVGGDTVLAAAAAGAGEGS